MNAPENERIHKIRIWQLITLVVGIIVLATAATFTAILHGDTKACAFFPGLIIVLICVIFYISFDEEIQAIRSNPNREQT